jgi:hypothetical protein
MGLLVADSCRVSVGAVVIANREVGMTLPHERSRAVVSAELFLTRLAIGAIKRVPKAVREEANRVLRHYPVKFEVNAIALGDGKRYFGRVEE